MPILLSKDFNADLFKKKKSDVKAADEAISSIKDRNDILSVLKKNKTTFAGSDSPYVFLDRKAMGERAKYFVTEDVVNGKTVVKKAGMAPVVEDLVKQKNGGKLTAENLFSFYESFLPVYYDLHDWSKTTDLGSNKKSDLLKKLSKLVSVFNLQTNVLYYINDQGKTEISGLGTDGVYKTVTNKQINQGNYISYKEYMNELKKTFTGIGVVEAYIILNASQPLAIQGKIERRLRKTTYASVIW